MYHLREIESSCGSRNIIIFWHVTKLSIEYQAAYVPFERDQVIA